MIIFMPGGRIRGGGSSETAKLADQLLMLYGAAIILAGIMFVVCMWNLYCIGKEKREKENKPVAEEVKNDHP